MATNSRISSGTTINVGWKSLGVDGADADELIDFVSREIGWPLKNFDWDKFFGPELGWNSILYLTLKDAWKKLTPLSVGDLADMYFESQPDNLL
jgi:hypothetical protein